jgi:hypothetical protein
MRRLGLLIGLLNVLVVVAIAAPSTAFASVADVTFSGGSLTGLTADAAYTQGSLENLTYSYQQCGTEPAEVTCTWEVRANLYSDPARRCVPSTPESQPLWDSGQQSGNGTVESGPLSFALEGCRGQILSVVYETMKTFNPEEEEGPLRRLAAGGSGGLVSIVVGAGSPYEDEVIPNPSPADLTPHPPPALAISANCRSLQIGSTRYAFVFRDMGCHKATNLATMVHLSGAAPSGYACRRAPGNGKRCWRRGHPEKYVEWRLPAAPPAGRRS